MQHLHVDNVNPSTADAPVPDPRHVTLREYVLVFADNQPPKEHAFSAISDEHAMGLMQKEYPGSKLRWTIYRIEGEDRKAIYSYPERK